MGKRSPDSREQAVVLLSASLATSTQTASFEPRMGPFSITLSGTWAGTVTPQRSGDGGATWVAVAADSYGTAAAWTANFSANAEAVEPGELWRFSFAYTSGTVAIRVAQNAAI